MYRSTLDFINRHPLNKSKTKEAHAFPKAKRFPYQRSPLGSSASYNNDSPSFQRPRSQQRPRGIKFTQEKRFRERDNQMKEIRQIPSPGQYQSKSFLQESRGVHFPRQLKHRNGVENATPGPGSYNLEQYTSRSNNSHSSFSISRSKSNKSHHVSNGSGFYSPHKAPHFGAGSYTIGNTKRWDYKTTQQPGPGQYETKNFKTIDRSGGAAIFGDTKRKTMIDKNPIIQDRPGPGAYNVEFSQFSEGSKRIIERVMRL